MKTQILNNFKRAILFNFTNGLLQASDSKLEAYFVSKIKATKNLFKVTDVIIHANFDLNKTYAIAKEDLTELCYNVQLSSEDEELYYSELKHFDYKDAVLLQIHIYFWLKENSYLIGEEKCLLMMVIYERLFDYDLQEIYDTLKSLYPEEDDIDDYSNSTIEVYDSNEFTDFDGEFHAFLYEMICCFERNGYSDSEELLLEI